MDKAMYLFAAAAGGFFGAGTRYLLTWLMCQRMRVSSPTSLLIINALGTFILGLVLGDISHIKDDFEFCLLTVGFCGSLTTFSAFARQLLDYRDRHSLLRSIYYWIASIAIGVVVFVSGLYFGQLIGNCRM